MTDHNELNALSRRYRDFAESEAKRYSPSYWSFTTAVAENEQILQLLAALPRVKQQPNLLLAAVRLLYGVATDADTFCGLVIRQWKHIRAVMLARSTQTNEPARCATLLPVLSDLKQPIALLEVGASAGLCLFPDKYAYRYGDVELLPADADPPLFQCTAGSKTPLPSELPHVSWRGGIDLHPLSVANDEEMDWLRLLVWPEQTNRLANLERAVQVARRDPPRIVEGDLLTNAESLVLEMPADATKVVFHSAVLAYLPRAERERFLNIVSSLDVTWISNEHPSVFPEISEQVRTDIPAGRFLLSVNGDAVAMTGPHGQSIDWL